MKIFTKKLGSFYHLIGFFCICTKSLVYADSLKNKSTNVLIVGAGPGGLTPLVSKVMVHSYLTQ